MSITLDDIYHDYDKNDKLPVSINKQGNNKISKYRIIDNYDDNIRKIKKNIIENLKTKHYIKIGEKCPICYEAIYNRKNAFLTDCGHSFHYDCIIEYDYKNSFNSIGVYCPICRQDMGDYNDFKEINNSKMTILDELFNFECNIKNKLPKICYNLKKNKYNAHFYILEYNNCSYCKL